MITASKFLSAKGKSFTGSLLAEIRQKMAEFETSDDDLSKTFITMASGLPDPVLFPVVGAHFTLTHTHTDINLTPQQLTTAQQYGSNKGYPPLVQHMKGLMERAHNPPNMTDREVIITVGATHGLYLVTHMLINPGDCVYVETPTYCGIINILKSFDAKIIGIDVDNEGMMPTTLQTALQTSKELQATSKYIYLNPTGSNPTGQIMSEVRRGQIYDLACQYDMIIVEDDPYYFLNYSENHSPPSFLSLDKECRVIRVDSMSKLLGGGYRIGWVTIYNTLAVPMLSHMQDSMLHAGHLSQVVISEILRVWGQEGLKEQIHRCCTLYTRRRNFMLKCAQKHLQDLCEWKVPDGGLFLWVKINGIMDTDKFVHEKCLPNGIWVARGQDFYPTRKQYQQQEIKKPQKGINLKQQQQHQGDQQRIVEPSTSVSPYIRLSFSPISLQKIEEGCQTLASLIREMLQAGTTT